MELAQFHQALRRQTPRVWVTPTLIAANVILFGLMAARGVNPVSPTGESVIPWGADYGPLTLGGEWWRLLAAAFIHFGVIHVAMNMFVLWGVGGFVERLYGNLPFLALYLCAGLAGSLASVVWNPLRVSAGASGAVFGVYGALGAYLLRRREVIPREALQQLWQSTATFILFNVLFGFSARGIDNAAHLGGLAGGFIFGMLQAAPLGSPLPGRLARALIVVALAAGLAVVGLRSREAPPDFIGPRKAAVALYNEIASLETAATTRYNRLVDENGKGATTNETIAKAIETEILPPLADVRARVEELGPIPTLEPAPAQVARYVRAHEAGWRTIAAGMRAGDEAGVKRGLKELEEAGRVFKERSR